VEILPEIQERRKKQAEQTAAGKQKK
jgi:hypothetical protein